jgi:hypothetical protein
MNMNRYRFLQTLEAIAALWIVVGLLTAGAGALEWRRDRAMGEWPAAEGAVVAVETFQAEQRGRSITYYDALRIVYRYATNDASYENDRVGPGDGRPPRADSAEGRELAAAYAPGDRVTVYYNPADPAESVLNREPRTDALRAGAALAALGLVVLGARLALRRWPEAGST